MNEQERHNLFSELITCHQSQLYGYIFAIVRNWEDADDLFQSVCLVLWRKFELFRPGSSFFLWARQVAKIEVSNYLRRNQLPNRISEQLADALADTVVEYRSGDEEPYLDAMRRCKAKLIAADAEMLDLHYVEDLGSRQIADRLRRSQASVCHSLKRIHRWLLTCVQLDLARQENSREAHS